MGQFGLRVQRGGEGFESLAYRSGPIRRSVVVKGRYLGSM